jgi:hypothetical protein
MKVNTSFERLMMEYHWDKWCYLLKWEDSVFWNEPSSYHAKKYCEYLRRIKSMS